MTTTVELRSGVYRDSVTLMQVSRALSSAPDVDAALVAMATPLNLALLPGLGFSVESAAAATPNDLLVAVRASDGAALQAALARLEELLSAREEPSSGGFGSPAPARTVGSALRRSAAPLAVISVPGRHAFVEAIDALRAGAWVMLFSDNVSLAEEIALKDEAARRGVLVMGPDCGTAIVGGVGLGFANVVRPGPVGIVAASGTGAQQVSSLLDSAGIGVSAVLGTGGRDVSREVGARSTLQAMELLDAHPGTELIVVLSKPPAPEVADAIDRAARRMRTPTIVGLLGRGRSDLTALTGQVLAAMGQPAFDPPAWAAPAPPHPSEGKLRGLFSGGTLCDEAMVIASEELGRIDSNIPLEPAWALGPDLSSAGHLMIDFGDDALTQGRAHPMIDWSLRLDRLATEAADPACAVILLDVVLGYGSHEQPAAVLAPALRAAHKRARIDGRDLAVVVSLVGTAGDPQGLDATARALQEAGASVHLSNAAAARAAVALVSRVKEPVR
jgi:FdrA protein